MCTAALPIPEAPPVSGGSVLPVLRTTGEGNRGCLPTGAVVVWMVSHLSHYFHIKRRGYVRESIVSFECVFKPQAAKRVLAYRGPFLALPPDPWEDPFSLHCYYGYFGRKILKVLLYGMIGFSSISVAGVNCISPVKFVSIVFLFCFLGF